MSSSALRLPLALSLACLTWLACSSDPPTLVGGDDDADDDASFPRPDSSTQPGNPDADPGSSSSGYVPPPGACTTHFHYAPAPTDVINVVRIAGEFNEFRTNGPMLVRNADGSFDGDVALAPGRVGYKLLVDGNYILDPESPFHKYVGGEENSAVDVVDCAFPTLTAVTTDRTRSGAGAGHLVAHARWAPGLDASPLDSSTLHARLRKDFTDVAAPAPTYDAATGDVAVDVSSLADGKYTIFVDASDQAGHAAKPLRLVFWIEASKFDWQGSIIYMGMNDRVKNGDPSNDAAKIAGVDDRAQFMGGDLEGVRQVIASGHLDDLGVNAIWLSPFNTNPEGAFDGSGNHKVTGYHGYWPIRAREVDARLGGADALRAVVAEAHAHGIRVLQDFVVNHVHEQHEYYAAHPDWFRTSCICGTDNCDWTVRRLDCLFTPYLPDVNWSIPEVSKQFEEDATWWVDEFDLDGLRMDAVKHVEDLAVRNLSAALRSEFEPSGQRLFLTGETAMGWSDCNSPACVGNDDNYGTINRYVGPHGLDGQFDFVLYHAASYNTFAYQNKSLYHANYWANASQVTYVPGSIMTPYIGSHDTARFVSLAQYGGNSGIPGNQWDDVAQPPTDGSPYAKDRLALAWLYALPGAPLLYYGDEYGEWGGSDPNNRHLYRDTGLSADEQATLAFTKKLGAARRELAALRHGTFMLTPDLGDNVSVAVRRTDAGDTAVVVLSRTAQTVNVTLPPGAELPNGTVLHDRLGGASVTANGNTFSVTVPAYGAAYLAP